MLRLKGKLGWVCSFAVLCSVFLILSRVSALGQNTNANATTVKALLEQKRDVLKQRLEAFEVLVKSGTSAPEAAIAARNDLLDAELALASEKTQRIELLEQKLANAKVYESLMNEQRGNARVLLTDALMATARRLDAEVELLRARE